MSWWPHLMITRKMGPTMFQYELDYQYSGSEGFSKWTAMLKEDLHRWVLWLDLLWEEFDPQGVVSSGKFVNRSIKITISALLFTASIALIARRFAPMARLPSSISGPECYPTKKWLNLLAHAILPLANKVTLFILCDSSFTWCPWFCSPWWLFQPLSDLWIFFNSQSDSLK